MCAYGWSLAHAKAYQQNEWRSMTKLVVQFCERLHDTTSRLRGFPWWQNQSYQLLSSAVPITMMFQFMIPKLVQYDELGAVWLSLTAGGRDWYAMMCLDTSIIVSFRQKWHHKLRHLCSSCISSYEPYFIAPSMPYYTLLDQLYSGSVIIVGLGIVYYGTDMPCSVA